jgi:outer membrane biosynthesis protein TonB
MPKPKKQKWGGGKGALSEELDAYDYTYEEEYYPPEPSTKQEAPPSEPEKPKEVPKPKEVQKPKQAPKPKEPEPEPEPEPQDAKEIVLEQFDDWEQAMDALDAAISKQEEVKSLASNSKR